jgi:signal transduction histidine kinase/ActR/RegA family two-component response regulator
VYALYADDSVFIEIEEGVYGRIPLYELGLQKGINLNAILGIGDLIRAVIRGINEENRHFDCSNKAHLERMKKQNFHTGNFQESVLIHGNTSDSFGSFYTGKLAILLIDDNDDFCRAAQRDFSLAGHSIEYETSAQLGITKAINGNFDIVIVDRVMPEMDGLDVCKAIQSKSTNITVAIFTGESSINPEDLQKLDPRPLVLQKPFDIEDVEAACFGEVRFPKQKVPEVIISQSNVETDIELPSNEESLDNFVIKESERMAGQTKSLAGGVFKWDQNEQRLIALRTSGFNDSNSKDKMEIELYYSPIKNVAQTGDIVHTNDFSRCPENVKSFYKNLSRWLEFESILCYPILVKRKPRYAVVFSSIEPDHFSKPSIQRVENWAEVLNAKINEKEAYTQLERIQKLALRGELTSSLTHELRNRLGIITISLKTISRCCPRISHKLSMQKVDIPQEMETLNEAIQQSIKAADRIGDVVTAFSETTDERNQHQFDLSQTISSVLSRLSTIAERHAVSLKFEAPSPLIVYSSPARIGQVIENLVLNAIQHASVYRGKSGWVRISCGKITQGGKEFGCVRVADNGPGIHAANYEKIFEMGFSTRPSGFGIGLALCKAVMDSIGGIIAIEKSIIFEGTIMTVKIPTNIIKEPI